MTVEDMKKRKRELGYSLDDIAALSGLPKGTVAKVFSGVTKSPRKETVRALERALLPGSNAPYSRAETDESFHEPVHAYGRTQPRLYTTEDYYKLPEDDRCELIDGVFYDLAAPSPLHQTILGELYVRFYQCIRNSGRSCRIFFAPCDVRLDSDQYTILQPDLFVICNHGQVLEKHVEGAPDLVIEIVSETSRGRDSVLKLHKYKNAGVREYWIIDPAIRVVLVYKFDKQNAVETYSFRDRIPVGISAGECIIDFSEIDDVIH